MPQLCVACGLHPSNWRGFCSLCYTWFKNNGWEQKIINGDRKHAIEAIQKHYSSMNKFR